MSFGRACVTGGAGFIGSHLVRRLLAAGKEVCVLDNLSVGRRENVPLGARLVEGDILDSAAAERAMEGCDALFHLAARVAIRSSFDFVVEDTMTNVTGTASVLRAAQRSGTIKKVVSTSSMAVYADADGPVPLPETHPTLPVSPYGISKLASEQLTHSLAHTAGMQSVVLRLFNTFGPGQKYSPYVGVVTIFVNKLRAGEQPVIFGDGEQARDFVHVEDVVEAFLLAMEAGPSGETFNIGAGVPWTVNAVYAALSSHLGSIVRPAHAEPPAGELRYSIADISKARRLLGYQPVYGFAGSIGAVVDAILTRG